MSGSYAIRGYQYQFLRTLELILAEMSAKDSRATHFSVESPELASSTLDADIIDFAIFAADATLVHAQVKSTDTNDHLTVVKVLQVFLRLIDSGPAERYLLLTNQPAGPGVAEFSEMLDSRVDNATLVRKSCAFAVRSPTVVDKLRALDASQLDALRRCQIQFDEREIDETRSEIRGLAVRLRKAEHRSSGRGSAGILLGYLVSQVLASAAETPSKLVTLQDMEAHLHVSEEILAQCWGSRDWAARTGIPNRLGDVFREGPLVNLEFALSNPRQGGAGRIAVCCGPSGIGKSSAAARYAAANADLYDAVHWVDASSEEALRGSFVAIALYYTLAIPESVDNRTLITAVHRALIQTPEVYLVVFDNAVNSQMIKPWMPPSGHGHLLVTTTERVGWAGSDIKVVDVPAMTPSEARLLTCLRLEVSEPDLSFEDRRGLYAFVERMEHWPLALELGANYMRDCGITLRNAPDYLDSLVERSLSDQVAIPYGYPRTLVASIELAIESLREIGQQNERSPDAAAHDALLYSAFMLSRQIPIHLLLAAATVEPRDTFNEDDLSGPLVWRSSDLPLREIIRSIERFSLARRDEPLGFCEYHNGEGADSLSATISVNEIVQSVLRNLLQREGLTNEIMFNLAFHLSTWVSYIINNSGLHCSRRFLVHAFHVAEFSISNHLHSFPIATLLGNSATVHTIDERFGAAEEYLRYELNFLKTSNANPLVEMQTIVSLADIRSKKVADPTVAIEVVQLLERTVALASSVGPAESKLVEQLWSAKGILERVRNTNRFEQRCLQLDQVLDTYLSMIPITADESINGSMLRIKTLLLSDDFAGAIAAIERLRESSLLPAHAFPQLDRMEATAKAEMEDWPGTLRHLYRFRKAVWLKALRYDDIAALVNDVGIACIGSTMNNDRVAPVVLRQLVQLMDQYEISQHPLELAELPVGLTVRAALLTCLGDYVARDRHLDACDFTVFEAEDPARAAAWQAIGFLIARAGFRTPYSNRSLDVILRDVVGDEFDEEALDLADRHWQGATYDEIKGTLALGESDAGESMMWRLHSPDREAVYGGLIVGPPSSGKTSLLNVILADVIQLPEFRSWVCDPTGTQNFLPFLPALDWVADDPEAVEQIILAASAIVEHRKSKSNIIGPSNQAIIVMIDNAHEILSAGRPELLDAVQIIVEDGPASLVGLIMTTESVELLCFGARVQIRTGVAAVNAKVLRPEMGGPGYLQSLR